MLEGMLVVALTAVVAADTRPNLLLLFPDQWRYDWDGLYGEINTGPLPLHTPVLRGLAEKGTRFTQAYVPAPVCAPSRSCLASAREYDHAGVPGNFVNDYPINQTTFYTLLRDSGYHTMTTGKDDLTKDSQIGFRVNYSGCSYCTPENGLYHQEELGFSDGLRASGKADVIDTPTPHEMYGFYLQNHTVEANGTSYTGWTTHIACMTNKNEELCTPETYTPELYEDNWTAQNAVKLLRRKPAGKPWMMQISFPGPHPPFSVTAPMYESVSDRTWPKPTDYTQPVELTCSANGLPNNTYARCNYAAEIENLDKLFAVVLDEVKALGEMDNTIVCVSSDHGEMLHDHGDEGKSLPWQGSASVPLICAGPGITQNATISRPVATLDLSATFLDYAGVEKAENMTAVSLRGLLEGGTDYKDTVSSGLNKWRMVVRTDELDNGVKGDYKYICCKGACPLIPSTGPPAKDGWTEMLIDVSNDLFDMHDLAPNNTKLATKMRAMLPPAFAEGCSVYAK